MYRNLREAFWLSGMKKEISNCIAKYPNYYQVKVEKLRPSGKALDNRIPTWKWEMRKGFIIFLPYMCHQHNSIWVIVNRMNKSAHFVPSKTIDLKEYYARLYIWELVRIHGVLLSIIFNRGSQFTTHFYKKFQMILGIYVDLNTDFHL